MNIAVTGAAGFLGSALVQIHARRGDSIRILVRDFQATVCRFPSVHAFRGDLRVAETLPEEFVDGADVLYHCAAEKYDEDEMLATNIEGTRSLARLAAGRIGRWVQVSSVSVYGPVRSGTITETSPVQPDSIYGKTKAESEAVVAAQAAAGNFEAIIVRPSNIFGLRADGDPLFRLFTLIAHGWFFFVGEPQAVRNCVHVDSVASALVLCGTREAALGATYNVSQNISMEHLVAIVADEIGARYPRFRLPELPLRVIASVFGSIPGMPLTHHNLDALTMRASYSSERIMRDLGYEPPVSLEAGLRELARSWKRHR